MGLLGDLLSTAAGAVGETARVGWTSKREEKNMTPELEERIKQLMERAESGDLDALDTLANAYMDGTTLHYDPQLACELWTKAAEAGHVISMYNLGILYNGDLSKLFFNPELAGFWLNEASSRGDLDARRILNENYKWSPFSQKWKRR